MPQPEFAAEPLPLIERHVWRAGRRAPKLAREVVAQSLANLGVVVDDQRRHDILLAVSEAVSNAVEHAYRRVEVGTAPTVELTLRSGVDGLNVEVKDRGTWRPGPPGDDGGGIRLMLLALIENDQCCSLNLTTLAWAE